MRMAKSIAIQLKIIRTNSKKIFAYEEHVKNDEIVLGTWIIANQMHINHLQMSFEEVSPSNPKIYKKHLLAWNSN